MPFQAPNYIYPIPETPDKDAIAKGIAAGLQIAKFSESRQEKAKKNALDADVQKIYSESETKIAENGIKAPPPPPEPVTENTALANDLMGTRPQNPNMTPVPQTSLAKMAGIQVPQAQNPMMTPVESTTPSPLKAIADAQNAASTIDYAKAVKDNQVKRMEINADMHDKIIGAHIKHGFVKEAEDMKEKFMTNVEKMASLDPDSAQRIWNNSYLKKQYGEVDLKVLKAGEWKLTMSKDGTTAIMVNSKTGDMRNVLTGANQLKVLKKGDSLVAQGQGGNWFEVTKNTEPEKNTPHITQSEIGGEKTVTNYVTDSSGRVIAKQPLAGGPTESSLAFKKQNFTTAKDLWDKGYIAKYGLQKSKDKDGEDAVAKSAEEVIARNPTLKTLYDFGVQRLQANIDAGMDPVTAENQARIDTDTQFVRWTAAGKAIAKEGGKLQVHPNTGAMRIIGKDGSVRNIGEPAKPVEQKPVKAVPKSAPPAKPQVTATEPPRPSGISPRTWSMMSAEDKQKYRESRKKAYFSQSS